MDDRIAVRFAGQRTRDLAIAQPAASRRHPGRCFGLLADPDLADVRERVRGVPALTERRIDRFGRNVGHSRTERGRHRARLLFGNQIDAVGLPASAAVDRREVPQLRKRRFGDQHRMIDRPAAVAVHLDRGRHLETAAGEKGRCDQAAELQRSHPYKMP